MINVTAKAIENRLKADLNGWLEHNTKYKSSERRTDSICDAFDQTMKYYEEDAELAKETLHNVLFYSFTKKHDYKIDFDIPRFAISLSYEEYASLINYYELHVYLKRELWAMGDRFALELLAGLYVEGAYKFSMCDQIYIQLALDEDDEEKYTAWIYKFRQKLNFTIDAPQLYHLFVVAKECLSSFLYQWKRKRVQSLRTMSRLFNIVDGFVKDYQSAEKLSSGSEKYPFYNAVITLFEMAREVGYEDRVVLLNYTELFSKSSAITGINTNQYKHIQNNSRPSTLTLKEFMMNQQKEDDITEHEHIFSVIVSYICQDTFPNQQDMENIVSAEEDLAMERLENYIKEKHSNRPHMVAVFCKCIYIVRRREMFWKSVFKVMVQFLDLWIGGLEEARCADIFSSWISHENMLSIFYEHILKYVRHYQLDDNTTSLEMIKKLTRLFEKCLDHVETNDELLLFRDHVFENRDEREEVHMPILGLDLFWNIPFEQEMIKVTNQITSFEQDTQVPDEIIRRLIKLSVIWPYEVLRQLFLSSIQNKNQYRAIIPVLEALGNLSTLNKQNTDQLPLLLLVLTETLSIENVEIVEKYSENLIHFIKSCCTPTKFQFELPLILMPNSMVDQTLLPLKGVLNNCILQNLSTSCHIVLLEFSLHALNSFCESSLNDWTTLMSKSDIPGFLYCSPETYLIFLTDILALRSSHDEKPNLPLQDWEFALRFISKFSSILVFALNTQHFPRIQYFFTEVLRQKYNWKTQLVWYHITRGITKHSLNVPTHFFRITGALDGLFTEDKNILPATTDANEGWYELLTACKLSTCLTDELFKHMDQWTYNLLLLWKHPNEGPLLLKCLQHALHPKFSLSVSIEYKNLLVHFLNKVYESFPGVHQVIQEYEGYEDVQMLPIIQNLTETGTKQYFIVLYTTLLINNQLENSLVEGDKQDTYFVSHLVHLLQGLTNWGNISQAVTVKTSYNELKAAGAKLIPNLLTLEGEGTLGTQSKSDLSTEVRILEYPLLSTAELISDRALSILTLYHICTLSSKVKDELQQQSLNRFMLLIIEGMIDMPSQQTFQRMLQQQPKNRHKLWKQRKSNTKFIMKMRPIINIKEEMLLRPVIDRVSNSGQILQALGLTVSHKEQYLYFLN